MSELRILYGIPALSGLAVAFVLLGPGARRPLEAARVYGLPVVGSTRFAVRVESVGRYADLERPIGGPIQLEWSHAGQVLGATAATAGPDGWVELAGEFASPFPSEARLVLGRADKVLGDGFVVGRAPLQVRPSRWCEATGNHGRFELCVPRGIAVPELPEQVQLTWRTIGSQAPPKAVLEFTASGGEVQKLRMSGGPSCDASGCTESWTFNVIARAPTVSLDVELRAGDEHVTYHGELPLQAGGIWLVPPVFREPQLTVRSATPRRTAYLSLLSKSGRIWGGFLPLTDEPHGFASGTLATSGIPAFSDSALTLVIASDPSEPVDYVVAWPLALDERVEVLPATRLLDGMPQAIEREEQRMKAIRLPVSGLILVSAVAVVALLVRRIAREKRRLQAHLSERGAPPAIGHSRWGLALASLALLAVAFAALALVTAFG